ncbi:MAG: hypothetical protein R3B52_00575 [Candidatus Paceibacterota bacterium]
MKRNHQSKVLFAVVCALTVASAIMMAPVRWVLHHHSRSIRQQDNRISQRSFMIAAVAMIASVMMVVVHMLVAGHIGPIKNKDNLVFAAIFNLGPKCFTLPLFIIASILGISYMEAGGSNEDDDRDDDEDRPPSLMPQHPPGGLLPEWKFTVTVVKGPSSPIKAPKKRELAEPHPV